jgi:galactokinase
MASSLGRVGDGRDVSDRFWGEAHGRVNLIGEHTDYNEGFVLPIPIPQSCLVELTRRDGRTVSVSSDMDGREHLAAFEIGAEVKEGGWSDYIQGVTFALAKEGFSLSGFEARVRSSVPIGAGLSSSAALEVALLLALDRTFDLALDPVRIAQLAQRAETDFVGAPVGIMDQISASLGRLGEALFLDTRTLEHRPVRLPDELELVVIDSGIPHAHATGEYRTRRMECDRSAELLGVRKLRDVTESDRRRISALPPPLDRRASHVVTENQRVLEAVAALESADLSRFGALLDASHRSLSEDFDVSTPVMDRLVDLSRACTGVLGARMTGGGFGGSIVVATKRGTAADVAREILSAGSKMGGGAMPTIVVPADLG